MKKKKTTQVFCNILRMLGYNMKEQKNKAQVSFTLQVSQLRHNSSHLENRETSAFHLSSHSFSNFSNDM